MPNPALTYDRTYALSKLGFLYRAEIEDASLGGRRRVVTRLGQALLVEYQRCQSGHWAYSLPRHRTLWQVYRNEVAELDALEGAQVAA